MVRRCRIWTSSGYLKRCPIRLLPACGQPSRFGSGGLGPGNLFARADYPCVVITCDQATANIKLLKHLRARSPSQCFLLPMLCAQHRNGNVVEQITKLLGILPGSYCWAKCSSKGNFLKDLKEAVKKQLEQDLVILIEEPPGVQAEWSQAKKQAKLTLRLLLEGLADLASNASPGLRPDSSAVVEAFANFFSGPWTGLRMGVVCDLRFTVE